MKHYFKNFTLVILAMLIFIAGYFANLYFYNFHTVIPQQVYRSNQLNEQQFIAVIQQYHLKTIINLRGNNPQAKWYQKELAASRKMHIHHIDIALESKHLPSAATFKELVAVLNQAPRPILIHCESGVDRTGFASALVLILANDPSLTNIERQVSLRYFVFSNKSIGKQFLTHYKLWLAQNHLTTSRAHFLMWLNNYH